MNDFQTQLIAEYKKDIENLHKEYDKEKFYTEEDINKQNQETHDPIGRKIIPNKIGDSYKEIDLPETPKKRFDLFKDYYVGCELARRKINYISSHDSWNIMELEREKDSLEGFINEAKNPMNVEWFDKERKNEYLRFRDNYYETHLLDENRIPLLASIYTEYISFNEFLQQNILRIYMEGMFSKFDQITQIDKILKIICDCMETNLGYCNSDIRQILKIDNLNISRNLLGEILHKLKKDEYIREIESPIIEDDGTKSIVLYYTASFEGRFFSKNGGYREAKRVLDAKNEEDKNYRTRAEDNAKRLNHLTLFLGIVTLCAAAPLVMDYYENHFLDKISFLYFLSGLLLGMLIWWLISKLLANPNKIEANHRKNLCHSKESA